MSRTTYFLDAFWVHYALKKADDSLYNLEMTGVMVVADLWVTGVMQATLGCCLTSLTRLPLLVFQNEEPEYVPGTWRDQGDAEGPGHCHSDYDRTETSLPWRQRPRHSVSAPAKRNRK